MNRFFLFDDRLRERPINRERPESFRIFWPEQLHGKETEKSTEFAKNSSKFV